MEEGRSLEEAGLRQRFEEEADRPLKGDDLAAKALHKGRQALLAWAAGEAERASALPREAVEFRPQLAGGLALRLAERLCPKEEALGPLRRALEEEDRAWREAPPGLKLLRSLNGLPSEVWEDFWASGATPPPPPVGGEDGGA